MRIAIVGGGYAGAAVAAALLKSLPPGNAITIYEPGQDIGRGIAYAHGPDHHLLNVAAHTIALTPGEEGHFTHWVLETHPDAPSYREDDGAYFFPRSWFGSYVGEVLHSLVMQKPDVIFEHRREVARTIQPTGDALAITSNSGVLGYEKVIVAIGNSPTAPLKILEPVGDAGPCIAQSAWDFDPRIVRPRDHVVIVGGALTMADVVASLEAIGHFGPITCVSRNGRRPHVAVGIRPEFTPAHSLVPPNTARGLLSASRRWSREAIAGSGDWRPAIDFMRINVRDIWRALPQNERNRLRRHVRSVWEVHRYLMPPTAHRRLEALTTSGRFNHLRAKVLGIVPGAVRLQSKEGVRDISADVVVNASGFDTSYRTALAPIGALLSATGIDPSATSRDGLAVDDQGRVLGASERLSGKLYALGFLARANHGDLATVNTIGAVAAGIAEDICRVSLAN
jgi:uncharacterized NAD(P)/FAD-binding protein YdhS